MDNNSLKKILEYGKFTSETILDTSRFGVGAGFLAHGVTSLNPFEFLTGAATLYLLVSREGLIVSPIHWAKQAHQIYKK